MLAHVASDVLFFVYGLAGIGKTELVYRLVEELGANEPWSDATPVRVEIAPGSTMSRVVTQLLTATGAAPATPRAKAKPVPSDPLARLAHRLDARRYLLVIDDAQHLPARAASEALDYLSRHVRASRIFVVSRRELPLPADAPAPVITTLGPLDPAAAEQMMVALAERLQAPRLDEATLMRTTHGSPLRIQQRLASPAAPASALAESVDELSPAARRLGRAIAVARHPPSRSMLRRAWPRPGVLDDVLGELAERFMLDRHAETVTLEPLAREALLDRLAADELAAAHADAADVCVGELAAVADAPAIVAADAAHHALAAGRHGDARHVVERRFRAIAVAEGVDALFLILDRLREALPQRRVALELLRARCLVLASRYTDAARVIAGIDEPAGEDAARYWLVTGDIAVSAGERERARALFDLASACAPDVATRFDARLRRANVAAIAGEGPSAREGIAAALAELPMPTAAQRALVARARTASWLFEERGEDALVEARRASESADDDDLAMLELLAAIECDDVAGARAAARRIRGTGLRARVAALHQAILQYAEGNARDASGALVAAHTELLEHGDAIHAYLAGYYGAAALSEVGNLGRAQALAQQTAQLASRTGMHGLAARSLAQQAMFAAEAVQSGLAHSLATAALASANLGPRSRALAHCARARAYTLEGDASRALEHIAHARAAVADPALAAPRAAVDIEQAAVELVGGNLDRAVEYGERVVEYHGRDYEVAHARLVLSAAYIARGLRTDLVFAERTLAQARALADAGELRSIQVGCAILSAALARRGNRERAARELLASALRELDPERGSVYAGTLLAAIDGGAAARVIPGAVALLGHLGFTETVDCYLIDGHARRAATEKDIARERALRELFVDELHDIIVARRGEVEIRGRPMLCALLSVLVQAGGAPVTPETLYTRAWGVAEYHPLQHRNALYVAINRLRSSLREALPERDVIERASAGWRLTAGVDACAAVAVRARAKTM